MNKNWKNILGSSSTPVDPGQLIAYLNKDLSPKEAQAIEERVAADEFAQYALDGLESVANKKTLSAVTNRLNRDLHKKINKRNQAKKKLTLNQPPLLLATILLLLLLIVLLFLVITRLQPL
jgi:hypothetical protein